MSMLFFVCTEVSRIYIVNQIEGDRSMSELPKTYDPKSVEDKLYKFLSLIHISEPTRH